MKENKSKIVSERLHFQNFLFSSGRNTGQSHLLNKSLTENFFFCEASHLMCFIMFGNVEKVF